MKRSGGRGKNPKKKRRKKEVRRKRGKVEKREGGRWKWERRESYSWLQGNVRDDESKQTEEEVKIERWERGLWGESKGIFLCMVGNSLEIWIICGLCEDNPWWVVDPPTHPPSPSPSPSPSPLHSLPTYRLPSRSLSPFFKVCTVSLKFQVLHSDCLLGPKKAISAKTSLILRKLSVNFLLFPRGWHDTFPEFKFRYRYRNAPVPDRDDKCRNADVGCIGFDADA